MNRTVFALIAVLLASGALVIGYWAGSHHAPVSGTIRTVANGTSAQPDKPARKLLYYRNPMGLPDTSPVPKKDSMGMDYIAVYEGDEPDDQGVVKVSPERIQTLGVKTALAEKQSLEAVVRTVGRLEVNERAIVDVAPRFDGWIERLYVSATGDPVKRGQALFTVYSPELVSAYKELSIARELSQATQAADPAAHDRADRLVAAVSERLRNWEMAAGATRVDSSHLRFTAPATGIVLEKKAVEGMRFSAGTPIYRIADLSTIWVIADVYEQDLERVKLGQTAMIGIDAFPDRQFSARVTYLYPTLNAATRTTQVRLELPNRDGQLRPGMFVHVDIATGGAQPRLTVPLSAVIDSGSRQVVLVALDGGRFKPQPVKLGLRNEDFVEILDGLNAGDRVVVAANFLIDAESNLKAALANFTAPATSSKSATTYQAVGSLDDIDGADVTITHQPIPALKWPSMTMDFQLASPDVIKGVAPGSPIRFEFEQRGPGEFVITRIEATGAAKPKMHGTH
ncbi:MAG: efflux RND transporter periplasmic adaptor subunit [Thiobacillaceae bacterium]